MRLLKTAVIRSTSGADLSHVLWGPGLCTVRPRGILAANLPGLRLLPPPCKLLAVSLAEAVAWRLPEDTPLLGQRRRTSSPVVTVSTGWSGTHCGPDGWRTHSGPMSRWGTVSLGHLLLFQEALCPGGRHYLTLRRGPSEGWSGPCMDGAHLEGHVGGHKRPRAVSPNTRYLRARVLLSTHGHTHTRAHHMGTAQGSWPTAAWTPRQTLCPLPGGKLCAVITLLNPFSASLGSAPRGPFLVVLLGRIRRRKWGTRSPWRLAVSSVACSLRKRGSQVLRAQTGAASLGPGWRSFC